jgi:hypothetical protein
MQFSTMSSRYAIFCSILSLCNFLQYPLVMQFSAISSRYTIFCNILSLRNFLQYPLVMQFPATSSRYAIFCNILSLCNFLQCPNLFHRSSRCPLTLATPPKNTSHNCTVLMQIYGALSSFKMLAHNIVIKSHF